MMVSMMTVKMAETMVFTREFTLRMDSDHYVEEGFLTKTSLSHLLNHAVHNCPRLEKVVGEWTKVGSNSPRYKYLYKYRLVQKTLQKNSQN